jgi:hypothetical protein
MDNHFNNFFTSVGKNISESVFQMAARFPLCYLAIPEYVLKVIKKFKPENSCDIHGVSTKMIKYIGPEIAVPLAHIFNLSLSTGQFASSLKQCRVIPIFKSGDSLDCDNYRPILLLSSISKVLEKIVAEKLVYHLNSNDLLYQNQYGFMSKKSTEHNLMQIIDYITTVLNDVLYRRVS